MEGGNENYNGENNTPQQNNHNSIEINLERRNRTNENDIDVEN